MKDRGIMKWGAAFMLPEMLAAQRRIDWDRKKIDKPLLDEHQLEEINQTIVEAIENHNELIFTLYHYGEFQLLIGHVYQVDQEKFQLQVIDKFKEIHKIRFEDIVKVCLNDCA